MDTNKQCQVAPCQTVYTVLSSSFFLIDFEWYKIFSTMAMFSSPNLGPKYTMQKEDFSSHQNTGTCMEY
jgi:hypothetical protein